ncbi:MULTISPECIES: LysE family translocator [Aquimarina]|uniref:LysE family translocator n=1 Tax=Aquimarina TaxID=290174 RepID=UPI000945B6C3|nr:MULTISPECIES: LysE family transporter [Aquimarina]
MEFIAILSISIFMAISPGPDFFMVTKNSISYGRNAGIYSAIGICVALWVHITYSIAGLTLIISKSIVLFSIIKYLGATYLIFIGLKSIFSKKTPVEKLTKLENIKTLDKISAFKSGFITNALNPKTTIFFLSIFTQVIHIDTALTLQLIYGSIISLVHLVWFYFVAIFFSHSLFLNRFQRHKKSIESILGAGLIAFGLKVALATKE